MSENTEVRPAQSKRRAGGSKNPHAIAARYAHSQLISTLSPFIVFRYPDGSYSLLRWSARPIRENAACLECVVEEIRERGLVRPVDGFGNNVFEANLAALESLTRALHPATLSSRTPTLVHHEGGRA